MEDKKKVKSIKSADIDDYEDKKIVKKEVKKNIVIDDDFDERLYARNKLKYFGMFLLGIIATIALFSFLTRGDSNNSFGGNIKINDHGISASIAKVYDATVYIQNYNGSNVSTTGSGFVYKKDRSKGYILTNYHVVSGSTSIMVTFSDDTRVKAKFVGGDQYSDIAIITVPAKHVKKVIDLGSSSKSSLGDTVFTVGSPVNNKYRGTVTRGILSGKDRLVNVSVNGGSDNYVMKLLQTDAAINPGNSGGPLCNINGEVIGMNSYKIVKDNLKGVNFAISIEDITRRLEGYERGTSNSKPYIGITMVNLSDTASMNYYGLSKIVSTKRTKGVVVESVKTDGSARGSLVTGDIIYKVNGVTVDDMAYFRYELYRYNIGDTVKLTIERDGKTRTVSVSLKAKRGK